jgi:ABC-type branched-subunit amino acid transport system permease subunit
LVLLYFGHVSYIIVAVASAGLLVKQDAQKELYRHHPMWPQLILIAIFAGLWGYTLGYLNNI